MREDPIFQLVIGGGGNAAAWVEAVASARAPDVSEVAVPGDATTKMVFGMAHAERLFPGMPDKVSVFPATTLPSQQPGRVIVSAPQREPVDNLPCWDGRWEWLRDVARLNMPGTGD